MYKLLVVDDESRQAKSLAAIINQLKPDYDIAIAYNGEEALEILQNSSYDILFTDIRMPVMDGLHLIERLNEKGIKIKVVILSGYSEFEYAQKAMRYGVVDYLLKPVSKTNLEKTLDGIDEFLKKEQEIKYKEEEIKKKLNNTMKIYLDYQLNKWVKGKLEEHELSDIEAVFPFKGYGLVLVTVFSTSEASSEAMDEKFIKYAKDSMRDTLRDMGNSLSFMLESESREMVTILASDGQLRLHLSKNQEKILGYIRDLKETNGKIATIGVGNEVECLAQNISESYNNARAAVTRRFFVGLEKVIFSESNNASDNLGTYSIDSFENSITEAVNNRDKLAVTKIVMDFFKNLKNVENINPDKLREDIIHLLLIQAKNVYNLIDKDSYMELNNEIKREPFLCEECKELRYFTNIVLEKIIDISDHRFVDKKGMLINKCKKYIDEKYMEDISLEVVASKYYFNPSYFSSLFKNYLGIGFSEYLLNVRIQNAKRLLVCTSDNMSSVAAQVGFKDAAYFNRVFKREVGISPLKFRQMNVK